MKDRLGRDAPTDPFGDSYVSLPGENWYLANAAANFPGRKDHTSVVYDSKMWVIGGYSGLYCNDIWNSVDGKNWIEATNAAAFNKRAGHTSVVFDSKMWVIGGLDDSEHKSDVWYSDNGVDWQSATLTAEFGNRAHHSCVVYDSKIWVIGGTDDLDNIEKSKSDVWFSTDGISWQLATPSGAFGETIFHDSIVFNSEIWILGGAAGEYGFSGEVWHSVDGINWENEYLEEAVASPKGLVHDSKIWIIDGYFRKVYYSKSGYLWIHPSWWPLTPFSYRFGFTSLVYDNKMWVIGGLGGTNGFFDKYYNDVWYAP